MTPLIGAKLPFRGRVLMLAHGEFHRYPCRLLAAWRPVASRLRTDASSVLFHASEANIFPISLPVAGSLAIVLRPRGGDWLDDDIRRLNSHGTQVVVSLLCDSEYIELGLEEEAAACARHDIGFISLPIPDLGAPIDTSRFIETVNRLTTMIRDGTWIAVHCRQSVGRSGLLAASVAMACGIPLLVALETISKARGVAVPETQVQRDWLQRIEPRLLNPTR